MRGSTYKRRRTNSIKQKPTSQASSVNSRSNQSHSHNLAHVTSYTSPSSIHSVKTFSTSLHSSRAIRRNHGQSHSYSTIQSRKTIQQLNIRTYSSHPPIPIVSHPLPDAEDEAPPRTSSTVTSSSSSDSTGAVSATPKKQLMGLTLPDLQKEVVELGLEKFRAKQIFEWVYKHGATSFDEMTNIKKQHIERLHDHFTIYPIHIKHIARATDGTKKYVVGIEKKKNKGDTIETVFIPRIFHQINDNNDRYPHSPGTSHNNRSSYDNDEESLPQSVNYDVSSFLKHSQSSPSSLPGNQTLGSIDLLSPRRMQQQDPATSSHVPMLHGDFSQHPFDKFHYTKGTVCVSSQVGCSLACTFCHTGTMPKSELRNLTTAEIISQLMAIKQDLNDFDLKKGKSKDPHPTIASNIVFMGMGEPLYNYNNIARALDILLDPNGLHFGRRHLTVSTSGVVPMIDKLGKGACVNLAISLHAVTNELRDQIVPINKLFPLEHLLAACRDYPGVKNTRKITWEYVMLNGVNDSEADARELLRLTKGIPSLVNLIPFNPWPGSIYTCSSMNRMKRFQEIINNATSTTGIRATIRNTTGQSEMGGCGMLNSKIKAMQDQQNTIISTM